MKHHKPQVVGVKVIHHEKGSNEDRVRTLLMSNNYIFMHRISALFFEQDLFNQFKFTSLFVIIFVSILSFWCLNSAKGANCLCNCIE